MTGFLVTFIEAGNLYWRSVGLAYEFFGLGMVLYFAPLSAGQFIWTLGFGFPPMLANPGGG